MHLHVRSLLPDTASIPSVLSSGYMADINTWELVEFSPDTASYTGYAHRRSSKTSDEVTDAITSLTTHVIGGMGLRESSRPL